VGGGGTPPQAAARELAELGGAESDAGTGWTGRPWATALIVFSGPGAEDDLASRLRARGVRVAAIDTKVGGHDHDVLRPAVGDAVAAQVAGGDFDMVFIATPCESYSVQHRPQLRSRRNPLGLPSAPAEWQAYLSKHNRLAQFTARLVAAADAAGAAWMVENPADRGDRESPAWWERYADHAPLWLVPAMAAALTAAGAGAITFAQCAFQAAVQKWTTVAHAPCLGQALAELSARRCEHGRVAHEARASGRAPDGTSRSAAAAAYPPAMNEFIAGALVEWARRRAGAGITAGERQRGTAEPPGEHGHEQGGLVAHGSELGAEVAAACEAARLTRPRFASMRNLRPASAGDLRHEAFPGDLHAPHVRTRPRGGTSAQGKRGWSVGAGSEGDASGSGAGESTTADSQRIAREARLRLGPVGIAELYLDGVYDGEVQTWMQLADGAAADIRAGRRAARVPTRVIGQEQMQLWSRGVVWDCHDPTNCVPVARSDRHTVFPGARQIDRQALRRTAAAMQWHDDDIVGQAGEGGIETRADCPLETVLSFHHGGLLEQAAAADKVIRADWAEEWASRPTRHLPFVPCRILPRNVVMQERARLVREEGADEGAPLRLEFYLKPRITQDSSDGGDLAVNAWVPSDQRWVLLPTVQQLGRGVAICDTAGGARARAAAYVVDAESAFRFCPMQHADAWTQCFCWWDDDGAAGACVDRRLAFGGAYSPNRFERISTLVAAYVQTLQADFDAAQPPPQSAALWTAERMVRQERGELPAGAAQVAPRYLQVYIDDFCGAALDDEVTPPPAVAAVVISPAQVTSEGGRPAGPHTRAHVHAQLAVVGLRHFGLSASPGKVVVGDPVVALGLRVGRAADRIDCPPLKRAAVRADAQAQAAAAGQGKVDRRKAETLVGRLCNLSQVFPELKGALHGGYAVAQATWVARGRRRKPPALHLKEGSQAQRAWLELLGMADHLLETNEGVALAPELAFPPRSMAGADTVTSDASGVDGVGGYVFEAGAPSEVWLVSEQWPEDILTALQEAARVGGGRPGRPSLSMPAAELFGAVAVAEAVAAARGVAPTAITAVGDCDPAVGALNAASSGNAQMREVLQPARELTGLWLAVSVPREANVDADRLSHPELYGEVAESAVTAGLAVRRARITEASWAMLRRAAAAGTRSAPPRPGH
jgi:hypothetical protein